MFEEFYALYESEEQEVIVLVSRCIGGGYNSRGGYWSMAAETLGMVFCDTCEVICSRERLEWPVASEERDGEQGWGRFGNEQICRLKIRPLKEEWAKDGETRTWCISEVVREHEDCPQLQAILEEYHKPVVIRDKALGELTLNKDDAVFEGEIRWCGEDVSLSLEVNPESRSSWSRARGAARKLLADCETWDRAMRALAAKHLTGLANDCLSLDAEDPRDPEKDPISEEEFARRLQMTSLSVTPSGSFTAFFDCDGMFTDHAVMASGSLKKGVREVCVVG